MTQFAEDPGRARNAPAGPTCGNQNIDLPNAGGDRSCGLGVGPGVIGVVILTGPKSPRILPEYLVQAAEPRHLVAADRELFGNDDDFDTQRLPGGSAGRSR